MSKRRLMVRLLLLALLVPAVTMTGARVVAPEGGWWVRLVAFTPFAIALYALALLLLAVLFLVSPRGARRAALGALVFLILPPLAVHLFWLGEAYGGHPDRFATEGGSFTVMTSNLMLGRANPQSVIDAAVRHHADVLVLVEATSGAVDRLRAAGLARAFPFSAGRPADGPAGTVVFSRMWLTRVSPLSTGFNGCEMRVHLPERTVTLLAVHVRPPLGTADRWATDQVAVRKAATAVAGPVVIAGDFNATMDHQPMRELAGRGFRDAVDESGSGWQPTWPSRGGGSVLGHRMPSLLQIDHVLVDDRVRAVQTESVTIRGTDHRAVIAELSVR